MIKIKCEKCEQEFNSTKGLHIHKTRMHPYVPPPLPPKPKTQHVNYRDLVKKSYSTWGQEMTKEKEKHPSFEILSLGAMLEIINLLHILIDEVKRPR